MAYFEYGYVNTGYDVDSATQPVASEYNVILNFVYNSYDDVYEKIIEFNYNVGDVDSFQSVCDFNYDVDADYAQKNIDFNYSVLDYFIHSLIEFNLNVELPVFEQSLLNTHYDVGDTIENTTIITRLSQ